MYSAPSYLSDKSIGRHAFGHVSKAGPRPLLPAEFYDPNLPAVESLQAARHFKLGPGAIGSEGYVPWREPITGPFFAEPFTEPFTDPSSANFAGTPSRNTP